MTVRGNGSKPCLEKSAKNYRKPTAGMIYAAHARLHKALKVPSWVYMNARDRVSPLSVSPYSTDCAVRLRNVNSCQKTAVPAGDAGKTCSLRRKLAESLREFEATLDLRVIRTFAILPSKSHCAGVC